MTKPIEPTLTCSEVVERLANNCFYGNFPPLFDRTTATAILHSWRERRVQELEEALREIYDCGSISYAEIVAKRALAKSDEWREQIRKGAKHE